MAQDTGRIVTLVLLLVVDFITPLQIEITPKMKLDISELSGVKSFDTGNHNQYDHFKVLHIDNNAIIIGARNNLYDVNLATLQPRNQRVNWPYAQPQVCMSMASDNERCQNYIRVFVKTAENEYMICGTYGQTPTCRQYRLENGQYKNLTESRGDGLCPFTHKSSYTYVYSGSLMYSATILGSGTQPLFYRNGLNKIKTESLSTWLNNPTFISSFEYQDHVYLFFREEALEYRNCGKTVYPRVARVCKNDIGSGKLILKDSWTSFFKARLNCSIHGNYPFYFNQLQSVTEVHNGMIYAVFTTIENAITGSAICAFTMHDINNTFKGDFKQHNQAWDSWKSVSSIGASVSPHPAEKCAGSSRDLSGKSMVFIRDHPLMDDLVPPAHGNEPVLIETRASSKFTQVAVDWNVESAQGPINVIFTGTDDGRVLKSIKTATKQVVIEDIQLFPKDVSIVNLKVDKSRQRLIVVSHSEIKSIPLYRCNQASSCSRCVALQDPYCSWKANRCEHNVDGVRIQNLSTGKDGRCPKVPGEATEKPSVTYAPATQKQRTCPPCNCNCPQNTLPVGGHTVPPSVKPSTDRGNPKFITTRKSSLPFGTTDKTFDPKVGARIDKTEDKQFSATTLAIAVVITAVLVLLVGFAIGYNVSVWKQSRNIDQSAAGKDQQNCDLRKSQNRYDNFNEPYQNHNDSNHMNSTSNHNHSLQKQLNVVLNVKSKNTETKPIDYPSDTIQKPKKVYL